MGVRPHFTASCHKWQENLNQKKHHTKIGKQFGQPIWNISSYNLLQFSVFLVETFCTWNHRSASVPWPSSHAAWTKATKAMAWQVKVLQLESSDFLCESSLSGYNNKFNGSFKILCTRRYKRIIPSQVVIGKNGSLRIASLCTSHMTTIVCWHQLV